MSREVAKIVAKRSAEGTISATSPRSTGVCRIAPLPTGERRRRPGGGLDGNPELMRILATAAFAAFLTWVGVFATASVPVVIATLAATSSAATSSAATSSAATSSPSTSSPSTSSASAGTSPNSAPANGAPANGSAPRGSGQTSSAGAKVATVHSQRSFDWPLSPRPAVLRPFDPPRDQWSPGHRGVDLSAVVGQPVLSAGEGVVGFAGVVAGRGVLTVQHSGGLRTTYEPVDDRLASGTIVHRGTRVGVLSAEPGHCAPGGCLHWGAISREAYLDPLSLLSVGRPILLPLG